MTTELILNVLFQAVMGDSHVQSVAKEMFRHHVDGLAPVPACLREAVFRAVMVQANRCELESKVFSRWRLCQQSIVETL
jgi:hypothetical protein